MDRSPVNAIRLVPVALAAFLAAANGLAGARAPAARVSCGASRLTILAPQAGDTVRAPVQVTYRVRCFHLGRAPYGHIHAWAGRPGESRRYELRPLHQAGTVELPNPYLSGEHTLTFQLARANHQPLRSPGARAVVRDVVFESP